jgi:hypothetical protein
MTDKIRAQVRGSSSYRMENVGAPIAASANRIVASRAFENATATIAAQPDVPRNVTITITDANTSITAGVVTVTGITPQGRVVSEVFNVTGGLTQTGRTIFAHVNSVVISGVEGSAGGTTDVIVVGVGNRIGLAAPIDTSKAVANVFLGGARVSSPVVYGGEKSTAIDASAATYNGTKELVVYYNPMVTA